MPAGVIFRVGGSLDPSYKTALAQSVAEAKAANMQINAMNFRGDSVNSAVTLSSARARKEIEVLRAQQRDLKVLQAAMIAKSPLASSEKMRVADEIAKKEKDINAIYAAESALQVASIRHDAGLALSAEQIAILKASEAEQTAIQVASNQARVAKAAEAAAARKIIDAEVTEQLIRDTQGSLAWAEIAEEERVAAVAKAATERIAIERAADLAILEARVASAAAGKAAGSGHGPGGLTGIIRESLVIMREISMGRGTGRIGGSITLLAQYLGVLKFAVKSTATESLLAAKAARQLSIAMDVQALRAKGTAAFIGLESAAKAQNVIATEAETVANYELLTSKVALNAVFFVGIGLIVAAGAAAFFLWRHFNYLAKSAKDVADSLNPLKKKFTELSEAEDKASKSTQEYLDWKNKLLDMHTSESDALERKIKLLKEESKARGLNNRETLEAEMALLNTEEQRLKIARDKALAESDAASKAAIAGATGKDFTTGKTIDLKQAQDKTERLGKILDAAQGAIDNNPALTYLQEQMAKDPAKGFGMATSFKGAAGIPDSAFAKKGSTWQQEIDDLTAALTAQKQNAGTAKAPYLTTVADAQANYQKAKAQSDKLATDQAALDDLMKNKKATAEEIQTAYAKVESDKQDVRDELNNPIKESGRSQRSATERERVGIGAPQVANLQKQTLDVSKLQLQQARLLNGKIDKLIASGGGAGNPDGW